MSAERYMVDDAGTVVDKNTRDNFELAYELVKILNNYENTLNELKKENKELKQNINGICKDYEASHGMDIRNAEWFTAW